jgi:transcriptional regulator with XRE-family HTH domain
MNNLKEIIKSKGLKSIYLCERLQIHPSIMSGYIKGTRKPNQKRLRDLARILNVSIKDMFPNVKIKRINYYYI